MIDFDGTIRSLIAAYKTDPYSKFCKSEKKGGLRYATRNNYTSLMSRIEGEHGNVLVSALDGKMLDDWHDAWLGTDEDKQKIAMGHALIGMVRTLATFGATMLKDPACREIKASLHDMRFTMPKARDVAMTVEQIVTIRTTARAMGLSSIARAQAFQFELMLRQKDVIGEWTPMKKPETELTVALLRYEQWARGIVWEEIDDNLVLRHITSKRQKLVEKDLNLAPMVIDELQSHYCDLGEPLTRAKLPATGPVIIYEESGRPFFNHQFRRVWRTVADAAGIPKHIKNMDSRATGITEATDAGADLEHIRHAAAHSDIAMTQKYSRGAAKKDAKVQEQRIAHRAKPQ